MVNTTLYITTNSLCNRVTRALLKRAVEEVSKQFDAQVSWIESYPSINNPLSSSEQVVSAAEELKLTLKEDNKPYRFGEDFAYYLNSVDYGAFIFVGSRYSNVLVGDELHSLTYGKHVDVVGALYTMLAKFSLAHHTSFLTVLILQKRVYNLVLNQTYVEL